VKKPHYKEPENWKNTTEFRGRDRILEATASAANALLIVDNFDGGEYLQIIGEALDTDRVCVENNEDPTVRH